MIVKMILTECNCNNCKKRQEGNFEFDFEKLFIKKIILCKDCCKNLYNELGKQMVPKSPENINKKLKMKE